MSSPLAIASPPAARISSTARAAGEGSLPVPSVEAPRSFTTTLAPWVASMRACSRPMPRPAPVTIATRPSHSLLMVRPRSDPLSRTNSRASNATRARSRARSAPHCGCRGCRWYSFVPNRPKKVAPSGHIEDGRESMKRREVLKAAGAGFAAAAIAKPAIAQSMPELKWRCTSSFPKSLDTAYGAAETLAKFVAEATDHKFQIQPFARGEIIPPFQAVDAVTNNTVEMCHTAAYYFIGKDPTFALYCSLPFGPNARQQNAWFQDGDGMKLLNEFGKKFNIYGL